MRNIDLSEILRLPLSDRIDVVQQIWESVAADADELPVTAEQRAELERRLREHDANPDDVVEWSDVETRIRSSHRF